MQGIPTAIPIPLAQKSLGMTPTRTPREDRQFVLNFVPVQPRAGVVVTPQKTAPAKKATEAAVKPKRKQPERRDKEDWGGDEYNPAEESEEEYESDSAIEGTDTDTDDMSIHEAAARDARKRNELERLKQLEVERAEAAQLTAAQRLEPKRHGEINAANIVVERPRRAQSQTAHW